MDKIANCQDGRMGRLDNADCDCKPASLCDICGSADRYLVGVFYSLLRICYKHFNACDLHTPNRLLP